MESNWSLVALAAAVVFVFQLLRPWLAKPFQKLKTGLPTLPSSPAKSNKLLVLLILAAAVICRSLPAAARSTSPRWC